MRSSLLFWSCFSTYALAAPQPTSSSAPASQTWVIKAGDGNFQFNPHITYANPGDVIRWEFFPLNHSVVRSAYGNPCIPIDAAGVSGTPFSSQIYTQTVVSHPPPSFEVKVNNTEPIWFYCSTIGSCNIKGMVGVINPAPGQSFQKQQDEAKRAPFVLQPGEAPPSEGGTPTPTASANNNKDSGSSGLSGGAIAGIVIGAILGLCLIGALFFFVGRSKTYSDMLGGTRTHSKRGTPSAGANQAWNPNSEMSTGYQQQHEDWKGPHSALASPSYPPPYPSPESQHAYPGGTAPGPYQNTQYQNMQGQYQDNRGQFQGNRPPGLSRFSELGPSPSHEDRHIHELETPLMSPPMVSPMKFDDGEDVDRR